MVFSFFRVSGNVFSLEYVLPRVQNFADVKEKIFKSTLFFVNRLLNSAILFIRFCLKKNKKKTDGIN